MKSKAVSKIISVLLIVILLMPCVNVFAANQIVGYSIYTDIVAYINHYPLPSYNYNGTTLIYARDLETFGFDIWYNEYKNDVSITRNLEKNEIEAQITFRPLESQLTKKCIDIYSNDIKVYIGDQLCDSYSSPDGRTMIKISDLAKLDNISVAWVPEINAVKVWVKDGLEMRNTPFEIRRIDDNFTYYTSCAGLDEVYVDIMWQGNPGGFILSIAEIDKATGYCTMCDGTITITDVIDANGKSRLKQYKTVDTVLDGSKIKRWICESSGEPTYVPYFYGYSDDVLSHFITLVNDDLYPATATEKGGLIKIKYECENNRIYEETLKVDCLPYE